MNNKWIKVAGPPGCGKTHKMMELLDDLLTRYQPNRIAFVSFTRAAVAEAVSRASKRVVVGEDGLEYFRTAHGIAYRLLQLNQTKSRVIELEPGNKMWDEFCKHMLGGSGELGDVKEEYDEDFDEYTTFMPDEKPGQDAEFLATFIQLARNKFPLQKDYTEFAKSFSSMDTNLSSDNLNSFTQEWVKYLESQSRHDFTRMLEFCLEKKISPAVDALIVDEGQDLSPLQLEVIKLWGEGATEKIIAFDLDQTIYGWQGADPKLIMDLPTEKEIPLAQSYRCPQAVATAAKKLINRNTIRTGVDWQPTEENGKIETMLELPWDEITDAEKYGVPCFVLSRNKWFIKSYIVPGLVERAIPFTITNSTYGVPPQRSEIKAILDLSTSGTARKLDLKRLIKQLPGNVFTDFGKKGGNTQNMFLNLPRKQIDPSVEGLKRHGVKESVVKILSDFSLGLGFLLENEIIHSKVYDYYSTLIKNRNKNVLTTESSVKVGTIHSVKGAEADRVYLLTSMTRRTLEGEEEDSEPERRVWYVGMTRARKYLGLVDYETRTCFRYNEIYSSL